MKEQIERILEFVSLQCDTKKEDILSQDRQMPLPLIRGYLWYIVRRATGFSNKRIAIETAVNGYVYTTAGIGIAINRAMDAIAHDKIWAKRWEEAVEVFNLARIISKKEEIKLVMTVPYGMKNKINFEIKETK